MADRPGKTISFYTDLETDKKLNEMARDDQRSVSNCLTVLINWAWNLRFPPQIITSDSSSIYVDE